MLKLGTASADITPNRMVDLSGFLLRTNPATGVHDPLKVRWISLYDEAGYCALIGAADVLSFSRNTFQGIRAKILASLPDSYAHIGLSTSHTHSAPAVVPLRHCGKKDSAYLAKCKDNIVASAIVAAASQIPVSRIRLGSVQADLCINRRQGEDAPADREMAVLAFDNSDGQPAAVVVNYACHPVTLGHENCSVSADYPGYLCQEMENRTGAACLFLNGACGDINPRDAHHAEPTAAKAMGKQLADAAMDALDHASTLNSDKISWYRQVVKIPVRVPASLAEVHSRLDDLEKRFGVSRELFSDRINRDRRLLETGRYPRTVTLELSLLTIGDAVGILFVPGELFASIGLRAKAMALPRKLLISGFSNGSVGYLSDRKGFEEGGYEPHFAKFFYDFPEFDASLEDHVLAGIERLLNAAGRVADISQV